jgi:hypothetical protein
MPSQEASKNTAIGATLQRPLPSRDTRMGMWQILTCKSIVKIARRLGIGDAAGSPSRRRIMHTICRLAGALASLAIMASASAPYAQETKAAGS